LLLDLRSLGQVGFAQPSMNRGQVVPPFPMRVQLDAPHKQLPRFL
jgi:hypothetical protein